MVIFTLINMARFEIDEIGPGKIGKLVESLAEVRRTGYEANIDVKSVVRGLQEKIKGVAVKTPLR